MKLTHKIKELQQEGISTQFIEIDLGTDEVNPIYTVMYTPDGIAVYHDGKMILDHYLAGKARIIDLDEEGDMIPDAKYPKSLGL